MGVMVLWKTALRLEDRGGACDGEIEMSVHIRNEKAHQKGDASEPERGRAFAY